MTPNAPPATRKAARFTPSAKPDIESPLRTQGHSGVFTLAKRQQYELTIANNTFDWFATTLGFNADPQYRLAFSTPTHRRNNRA